MSDVPLALSLMWQPVTRVEGRATLPTDGPASLEMYAARLYDPLWTLHRQWQMGEFKGEDAATPASVTLKYRSPALTGWTPDRTGAGAVRAIPTDMPIEAALTGETFPLDLRTRIELGRLLLRYLDERGEGGRGAALCAACPLPDPGAEDPRGRALYVRVRGKVPDVGSSFGPGSPAIGGLPPALWAGFLQLAAPLYGAQAGGQTAANDPKRPAASPTWKAEHLDHELSVKTAGGFVRSADPDDDGALEWYAFDARSSVGASWGGGEASSWTGVPGRVRIAGMPSARYWDFEDSARSLVTLDLALEPDAPGLSDEDRLNHRAASVAWREFLLIHDLDWFMIHLPLPLGSLCWIESLEVFDVFGQRHTIQPASSGRSGSPRRWAMFGGGTGARTLLVSPSTSSLHERGEALEQLRFARDEQANLVWAIPRVRPDALGIGRPVQRPRLERVPDKELYRSEQHPPRLRYVPATEVPRDWVPFIPVQLPGGNGDVRFQRAAIAGEHGRRHTGHPGPLIATEPGTPLYIREEAIPRSGVTVVRRPMRARDFNGRVWTWVQRGSDVGRGEVDAGLRYDVAVGDKEQG